VLDASHDRTSDVPENRSKHDAAADSQHPSDVQNTPDVEKPGVFCGMSVCEPPGYCCIELVDAASVPTCIPSGNPSACSASGDIPVFCDDRFDCIAQGTGLACCADIDTPAGEEGYFIKATCESACPSPSAGNVFVALCDPTVPGSCADGGDCAGAIGPGGYYSCE
jgi:hypothetical protein